MKLIELHILQSFPVTCLNRDDLGSPKSALFGGANRARLSSQCLKRAIRLAAKELNASFAGNRTRRAAEDLAQELVKLGWTEKDAKTTAEMTCHSFLSGKPPKKKGKGKDAEAEETPEANQETSTLLYFSPGQLRAVAEAIAKTRLEKPEATDFQSVAAKAAKGAMLDAADIAIFGRMVANENTLTLEGAGLFSHALSTHKADNEIDFWTAVDDCKQPGDDAGAANMGPVEFTSACYYRYVALNLDLLRKPCHLGNLSMEELKQVVDAFLRAAMLAVPSARKNSMNGATLPAYVLGIVKDHGQPVQFINAFETPIASRNGIAAESIEALRTHHEHLTKTWNIATKVEVVIPDVDINTFCARILNAAFPA
jgi:CRISPR system Cascade subunit CasC